MSEKNRRDFLMLGGSALAGAALLNLASAQPASAPGQRPGQKTTPGDMPPGKMKHANMMSAMIPGAIGQDGEWQLPPLPYAYDALEPHIDAQTMQLHHGKHHQSYVDGLKKAEKKLTEARDEGNYDAIEQHLNDASFHGAGHFLHCVFWDSMGPQTAKAPEGPLAQEFESGFGGFEGFRNYFGSAALKVKGSGWAILAFQIASGRLTVLQAQNHNLLSQWGLIPLLCIDVWEHAYYLKYQNNRAEYIKNWWNVVNWPRVGERYAMLRNP